MRKQVSALVAAVLISAIMLFVLLHVLAAPLAAPTITAVVPSSVTNDRDNPVVLSGHGFEAVVSGTEVITPPTIHLNSTSLGDAGWVSSTTLTTTVPTGFASGIYTVTVENPDGSTSALPSGLTVNNPAPVLSGVDPTSGTYGQPIALTLTGTGFVSPPTVLLDGTPCPDVGYVSTTTLTATVPAGLLPGVYDVVVRNPGPGVPEDTLADAFSLYSPSPSVLDASPRSGPNDMDITLVLTGTNLVPTPTVRLGSTLLEEVTWINPTRLTAQIPWGMETGVYSLTVANPGPGSPSSTLSGAYTVTQGFDVWTTDGPYGGMIWQVAVHPAVPTTIYAVAMDVGVFVSYDSGETWHPDFAQNCGGSKLYPAPYQLR